jgi:hypothetical protein
MLPFKFMVDVPVQSKIFHSYFCQNEFFVLANVRKPHTVENKYNKSLLKDDIHAVQSDYITRSITGLHSFA